MVPHRSGLSGFKATSCSAASISRRNCAKRAELTEWHVRCRDVRLAKARPAESFRVQLYEIKAINLASGRSQKPKVLQTAHYKSSTSKIHYRSTLISVGFSPDKV